MTKLEAVARAICRSGGENPDEVYGPHSIAEGRPFWVDRMDEARAAIEAMKGPTEEMTSVGQFAPSHAVSGAGRANATYEAMIDAALEGK